jgi:methyl acetate hydrolase
MPRLCARLTGSGHSRCSRATPPTFRVAQSFQRVNQMKHIESMLTEAVGAGDAPFLVAMTANSQGITWSRAAGTAAENQAADENTLFRIYSMTKAVAALAAMMLVDRGQLDIETEVEKILPEFSRIQVLEGFDDDVPVLRAPGSRCTVRQLLTHTSGFMYETINPDLLKYLAVTGKPAIMDGPIEGLFYPMIADPGTRWSYGIGMDWVGRIIEAIDGRRIDVFCQEEIFGPLGLKNTVFEIDDEHKEHLAQVSVRLPHGPFLPIEFGPPVKPDFYSMGGGLYSTASDYANFLRLFLNGGALNGVRLINEKTLDWMLENHIGDLQVTTLTNAVGAVGLVVDLLPGTRKTHSLGFMRTEEDREGMRGAGSQGWCGVLNTHYWFDRKTDVAAVYMTQMLPLGDPRFQARLEEFERAVYQSL